jgi:hypothetical protein
MRTLGLITTPCPILAPNRRSINRLQKLKGKALSKKTTEQQYQTTRLKALPGRYQLLLNLDRSVDVMRLLRSYKENQLKRDFTANQRDFDASARICEVRVNL